MKSSTRYLLALVLLLFLPLTFTGSSDKDFELAKNLDIYHTLMRELNMFYVDEIDPGANIKNSIDEMLKKMDPYTVYIPESRMEDLQLMTTGEYGGVGALIRQMGENVVITDPYENFPAQKSGLRAGDQIIKIDGRSITDLSSSQISEMMKGQVGSALKMTLKRPHTEEVFKTELIREKIRISNVPHYQNLEDGVGYIRLSGFTQGAANEVLAAYTKLKDEGMEKLVLDLRSNPGGLLIEAVDIMNIFVNQNEEIVSTRGKVKQWNHTYYCRKQPTDTLIPVAVLVNSQSASASEIVAGAMQDLDRGIVLGQRSFGKGLVQTTRDLSYNSKLKITTAKYYIPSGRCIQALDYSNRRADGSVGKVPDSLITRYSTKNGREVFDGGGIQPDIDLPIRVLSKISTALLYKDRYFDFATKYRNTHEERSPGTFKLSDEDFDDFVALLEKDSFKYETGTQRKFEELEAMAKREKYDEIAKDKLAELKELLKIDLRKDISSFEPEIRSLLEEEIVGRYSYQKGRLAHMLSEDPTLKKAIAALNNQEEYNKLLGK